MPQIDANYGMSAMSSLTGIVIDAGTVTPTTLNQSLFAGVDGTNLTAYTPNVGGAWTALSGTTQLLTNQASVATAPSRYIVDSAKADVTVTMDLTLTVNNSGQGLTIRATDNNNLWLCLWGTSSNLMEIRERNASVETVRASQSNVNLGLPATKTFQVTTQGDTINFDIIGHASLQYTAASFNNTATKHGTVSQTTTAIFDNFLITQP